VQPLSRRTVLRGVGTALALPLLEAMAPVRPTRASAPTRLVYVYVPNGVHVPDWRLAQEGALGDLPWILAPLQPHSAELSVLSGLTHDKGRANGDGPGDHARAGATFLTGVQPLKTDGQVRLGISADQVAARVVGGETRFRSLQLGGEGGRSSGQCDSGYACAYSNNISWQSETVPTDKEVDPRLVFDRLFRGGADALTHDALRERAERRQSVLDFVQDDARRLAARLGTADRAKLDEFQTGLRELELRIQSALPERVESVPDDARPAGVPADFAEHSRLLADVLVLALQTDRTRVATWMLANEGSNRSYRNLGLSEGHHSISHHQGDPAKHAAIRAINRHHVELFEHLLAGLARVREGDQRLLDACMVVYGSGLADGNQHAHHDLPILLCGRGNGQLTPGRHLRFPAETPMCDLHLALLERMGASTAALGDSRAPVQGI